MKLTLPANVPVTFYPTPGDDDRKRFSLMQPIGDITDERGGTVKALTDGRVIELHHSSEAKVIVNLNDILAEVIKATFYRLHLDAVLPNQEKSK